MKKIIINNAEAVVVPTPVITKVQRTLDPNDVPIVTYFIQPGTMPLPPVGQIYTVRYSYFNGANWHLFLATGYDSNGNLNGVVSSGYPTGTLYQVSFNNVQTLPLNTLFRLTVLSSVVPTDVLISTSNSMPLVL